MTDKNKKHELGCDECGGSFIAHPPDSQYTLCLVEHHCEKSIERSIKCNTCGHKNKRFWCYHNEVFAGPISDHKERDPEAELDYAFSKSK